MDFKIFQSFPVCGYCSVVCGDFEIFQSSPTLWCVGPVCGDFEILKFPCVWVLYCGGGDLKSFQSSPVCEPCAGEIDYF